MSISDSFGSGGIPRSDVIGLFASLRDSSWDDGMKPTKSVISFFSTFSVLTFGGRGIEARLWSALPEKTAWAPNVGHSTGGAVERVETREAPETDGARRGVV
jgi:hypothetical protein